MKTLDSLAEGFTSFEQNELTENKEAFIVDDANKANWVLRKIAEHDVNIKNTKAFGSKEISKVEHYVKTIVDSEQESIDHLTSLLLPYAQKEIEGKKSKTVKLPNGKMSFRKSNPSFARDDDKLLAFVKKNAPSFVKTDEYVRWGDYKETLTVSGNKCVNTDGEVVDGVIVTPAGPDVFTVKAE